MRPAQQVTIVVLVNREGPIPDAELQAMAKAASTVPQGYNEILVTAVTQKCVLTDA